MSRSISFVSLPVSRRASLTNFSRFLCRPRPPAPTSLPTSLRRDTSASCAESSALLRRLIAAGSLAAGRFRAVVLRRRDAGFFAGDIVTLLESSLVGRALCGAYSLCASERRHEPKNVAGPELT
jgi:hypothetical protein